MNLNKAMLIGRMTVDPELKALPNGTAVATFGIATNSSYKGKDGNRVDHAEFHSVVVYGKQAETAAQYLRKGQMVYVEGRIATRSWEKNDGSKGYKTEVIAERVQFGPKAGGSGPEDGSTHQTTKRSAKPAAGAKTSEPEGFEYPDEDINPEDIPF